MLPAVTLLASCAGCVSSDSGPEAGVAGLERELVSYSAGESRTCIPADPGGSLVVENRSTIVARRGGTIWVNRLGMDCPGFEPLATLIVDVHGSQYCRGDRVRAMSSGSTIPGPFCTLGDFTPYRRSG
jgi:hypothetical protein